MMGYLEDVKPCLERLEDPPRTPIAIFTSGMGCSIRVPELVEPQVLQLMLEFALDKFCKVEIIGTSFNRIVLSQLEQRLLVATASRNNKEYHIFLQVPLVKLGLEMQWRHQVWQVSQLVDKLKPTEAKLSIQISNWGDYPDTDDEDDKDHLQTFFQYTMAAGVQLGVVIGNCSSSSSGNILENEMLQKNQKLFLQYFSFLVCATTTWDIKYYYGDIDRLNYFATISEALDQAYMIKTAFRQRFPSKEIYFRPEFLSRTTADFLRTIRDVNQHAELYHMKYFAVNAFEYPSIAPSPSWKQGWWRVENTTNYLNPFDYFERESEHLNVVPWRPPVREKGIDDTSVSWVIYYIPSGLGFIMVIFALVLFAVWKWSKSRLLTRIEELEFLNGVSIDMDSFDSVSAANQFLNMKFDKSFEIPKTNLKSEEASVIGAGNFGVVYKALVNGALVAVKIPKEGISPDLFKTTLQEIKIMCFVGYHDNVVGFVGAYIKEIRRGIVQIATELCENGTLLSYLRGLSRSIVGTEGEDESLFELVAALDLNRFSLEIAAGMEFLSSKKVIHGDLATRNVLLDEHFTCKIGDFGLSRKLYEYETHMEESEEPLPWRWMAVETLDKREFSCKSDVWSYGVTLWEIYSLGSVPYPDANWTAEFVAGFHSGYRLQKPNYSTDELYEKLSECWNIDAEARPTFSDLCQYFRTIRESQYTAMVEHDLEEAQCS